MRANSRSACLPRIPALYLLRFGLRVRIVSSRVAASRDRWVSGMMGGDISGVEVDYGMSEQGREKDYKLLEMVGRFEELQEIGRN